MARPASDAERRLEARGLRRRRFRRVLLSPHSAAVIGSLEPALVQASGPLLVPGVGGIAKRAWRELVDAGRLAHRRRGRLRRSRQGLAMAGHQLRQRLRHGPGRAHLRPFEAVE